LEIPVRHPVGGFANIPFPPEHGSSIPDVKEQAGTLTERRAVGKGVRPAIAVRAGAILRGRSASAKARGLPDADVAPDGTNSVRPELVEGPSFFPAIEKNGASTSPARAGFCETLGTP
jgi:hypothetical protein